MDASMSWRTAAEFDLACARSRRRAAARRAASARRAVLVRRALRTFVALVIASFALVETTQVASAPTSWRTSRKLAGRADWCGIPAAFGIAFRTASRETGLSLSLLAAVAWEESRMDPHAVSPAGARGLLQLMPETARTLAVRQKNPRANVLAGARYLRLMVDRFQGDLTLALAAYNAGPTAVEQAGGAPSIATLRYAKNVEARAESLTGCA
jgi:soluble lytic murein transglycosylase-like protein